MASRRRTIPFPNIPSEPEEMNLGRWAAEGRGQAVSAGQKRYPWGGGYRPNAEAPKTRSPRMFLTPRMNPFKVC